MARSRSSRTSSRSSKICIYVGGRGGGQQGGVAARRVVCVFRLHSRIASPFRAFSVCGSPEFIVHFFSLGSNNMFIF